MPFGAMCYSGVRRNQNISKVAQSVRLRKFYRRDESTVLIAQASWLQAVPLIFIIVGVCASYPPGSTCMPDDPKCLPGTIRHYPALSGTIRHYPALSGTIRHYPALSGTIRHYPALSGTIRHYPALSGTIRHYPALSGTIRHYPALLGTTRHYPALAGTIRHYV